MGYTHYYCVSPEFDSTAFAKVAADFKKMITPLRHLGVVLADAFGEGYPRISPTEIRFNGLAKCGHEEKQLGITWPGKNASGVSQNKAGQQLAEITQGSWFAGAELETRACGGDCSHETFCLEQKISDIPEWKQDTRQNGLIFECTKTAFKPYDLAVNVCLVIAKHHLGEKINVTSDGELENWKEAMHLCQHFLGFGKSFQLDDEDGI